MPGYKIAIKVAPAKSTTTNTPDITHDHQMIVQVIQPQHFMQAAQILFFGKIQSK